MEAAPLEEVAEGEGEEEVVVGAGGEGGGEGSLGSAMGETLSAPNWASRKSMRRSRRSAGVRLACRLRVGRVMEEEESVAWEWECLLADPGESEKGKVLVA
jgi:hypothetical protein